MHLAVRRIRTRLPTYVALCKPWRLSLSNGRGRNRFTYWTFKSLAIPAAEVGGGAISALKKCDKYRFRLARFSYGLVRKQELAEALIEMSLLRGKLRVGKPIRHGIRVRIESWKIGCS